MLSLGPPLRVGVRDEWRRGGGGEGGMEKERKRRRRRGKVFFDEDEERGMHGEERRPPELQRAPSEPSLRRGRCPFCVSGLPWGEEGGRSDEDR